MLSTDTLRALLIFTKFKDDSHPGDPLLNERAWPLFEDPAALPPFAPRLLDRSPKPPYSDSSLTAYFHQQSLGRFVLYGEAYDSVLVSDHPEQSYHRGQGGYGRLTKELLDRIDGYGFDFSEYDHNQDGAIDYIFIVLRGDSQRDAKRFVWTGASCLDARCSGSLAGGKRLPALEYDGKKIDWNDSGSYIIHRTPGNIIPQIYHVRLMAHELGHDLWKPFFVHIPANQSNDVPTSHNRGRGRDCIGYVLMAGSGGALDCRGSETISAYERDLLGWIDCEPLDASQAGLRLGDLYTTGDCYTLDLGAPQQNRRLYLSNMQRIGYFDRLRKGGRDRQFDIGLLRATGLAVHLVDKDRVDVIAADNRLQLAQSNDAYAGDLFSPATKTQLTPWTRPNSSGFNSYPRNFTPSWAGIDNIRYDDSSPTLRFDFYKDFRQTPIIRENSWMGREMQGFTFEDVLTVTNGSVLTIEADVAFEGDILLDDTSELAIASSATVSIPRGSTLRMDHGSKIIVAGTLILDGLSQRSFATRITTEGNGRIVSNRIPRTDF